MSKVAINQSSLKISSSFFYAISGEYHAIALMAIAAYLIAYVSFPATPGIWNVDFMGWLGWADQTRYLESARAMAHGTLSSDTYVYPLGYPILAVPFVRWLPRHPFLIPNLFLSVGIVLAFYASCRKLITRVESAALTFILVILSAFAHTRAPAPPGGLIWSDSLIVPWNLIPVFFAAYLASWLLVFNKADFQKLWIASVAIALAFFSRPPDVLFLGLIYLAGLTDLKTAKEKMRGAMILIVPCSAVLAIVLISKWAIFHSLLSPYDLGIRNQGFSLYDLPFKFYVVFFDGLPIHGYKESMLLPQMPWLMLCIPGMLLLGKRTRGKSWFLMASIVVCLTIYISFNAQVPSNTFDYAGYRYFVWVFPYLGLCAYLTLTRSSTAVGRRKTVVGIVAGVLIGLIVGWKEIVVATVSPATPLAGNVSQIYNSDLKKFSSEISLPASAAANGLRIVFSRTPSINMQVSADWHHFSLVLDGKDQTLYKDYNLYQLDNVVYVSFRNAINQTGKFRTAVFQYDKTEEPLLDRVLIVRKRFAPFAFSKRLIR